MNRKLEVVCQNWDVLCLNLCFLTCDVQFSGRCGASNWRDCIIREYWTTWMYCVNNGVTRAHTEHNITTYCSVWFLISLNLVFNHFSTDHDHLKYFNWSHNANSVREHSSLTIARSVPFLLCKVPLSAFSDAEHCDFLICGYFCMPVSRLCYSVKCDSDLHCSLKWRARWFCSVRALNSLCLCVF